LVNLYSNTSQELYRYKKLFGYFNLFALLLLLLLLLLLFLLLLRKLYSGTIYFFNLFTSRSISDVICS